VLCVHRHATMTVLVSCAVCASSRDDDSSSVLCYVCILRRFNDKGQRHIAC